MSDYATIIASTMAYVDNRIMELHPKSVSREVLHKRINRELCIRIKQLCLLSPNEFDWMIDNIFIRQLVMLIEEQRVNKHNESKTVRTVDGRLR